MSEMQLATMKDQLPANIADFDLGAFDETAAEMAISDEPIVRFIKGDWYLQVGQEKLELDRDMKAIGNVWMASKGWIRFHDQKVAERRVGFVAERFKVPARDELGHNDESEWQTNDEGDPQDPWTQTVDFPAVLVGEEENKKVKIAGTSRAWQVCMSNLFAEFSKGSKQNPGKVPLINLGRGTYNHRTRGVTKVPVLTIEKWVDPAKVEVAEAETQAAEQPETKKKAKF